LVAGGRFRLTVGSAAAIPRGQMECSSGRIVIKRTVRFRPKRQLAGSAFLSFEPFSEGKKDINFITGAAIATWQGNHRGRPFAINPLPFAGARRFVWSFPRL
jgi:hypothetical protein